jgi:hypothetical protein
MYRHRNYAVSAVEHRAFGSIGAASRRAIRAAQPKPASFSIEQHRNLSASEKFHLALKREMQSLSSAASPAVL